MLIIGCKVQIVERLENCYPLSKNQDICSLQNIFKKSFSSREFNYDILNIKIRKNILTDF